MRKWHKSCLQVHRGLESGEDVPISEHRREEPSPGLQTWGQGVQTCLPLPQDPMGVTDDDISKSFSGQTSQQYQERMKIQAVEGSRMPSN